MPPKRNKEITYRDDGVTYTYDKTADHKPGQIIPDSTFAQDTQQKIYECSEIIKHTFVEKRRGNDRKWVNKQLLCCIRRLIGFDDERAWISRSWVYPSMYAAGFIDIDVSPIYDMRYPAVLFNLHWFHNIPKPVCDLVIEYMGFEIPSDSGDMVKCFVCNKLFPPPEISDKYRTHCRSVSHKKRLESPSVPIYMRKHQHNSQGMQRRDTFLKKSEERRLQSMEHDQGHDNIHHGVLADGETWADVFGL